MRSLELDGGALHIVRHPSPAPFTALNVLKLGSHKFEDLVTLLANTVRTGHKFHSITLKSSWTPGTDCGNLEPLIRVTEMFRILGHATMHMLDISQLWNFPTAQLYHLSDMQWTNLLLPCYQHWADLRVLRLGDVDLLASHLALLPKLEILQVACVVRDIVSGQHNSLFRLEIRSDWNEFSAKRAESRINSMVDWAMNAKSSVLRELEVSLGDTRILQSQQLVAEKRQVANCIDRLWSTFSNLSWLNLLVDGVGVPCPAIAGIESMKSLISLQIFGVLASFPGWNDSVLVAVASLPRLRFLEVSIQRFSIHRAVPSTHFTVMVFRHLAIHTPSLEDIRIHPLEYISLSSGVKEQLKSRVQVAHYSFDYWAHAADQVIETTDFLRVLFPEAVIRSTLLPCSN